MKKTGLDIENQGHPSDYQALVDSINSNTGIGDAYTKPVPAKTFLQLHSYKTHQYSLTAALFSTILSLESLTNCGILHAEISYLPLKKLPSIPWIQMKEHGEQLVPLFNT
ncbi:hypothetical protein ACHAW6_008134 [Cyclotella cf. meneghiniana]